MLLTMYIVKVDSNRFQTHVIRDEGSELAAFESPSISMALRKVASHALPDLSGFHIWYEHVCAGTTLPTTMRSDPEGLAHRLIAMHAMFKG